MKISMYHETKVKIYKVFSEADSHHRQIIAVVWRKFGKVLRK